MSQVDIAPLLDGVQKPARYIGGETGQVVKPPAEVHLRFALCFPDLYEVAESHLGIKLIYRYLNGVEGVQAERVYAPAPDMGTALERSGTPLFSLETRRPLSAFDAVGFSLNYELSFTTLLYMLDLGGIPLWSRDRGEGDPLILAGGPAMFNPEPVAPFLDAIFIGDADRAIVQIARSLIETRDLSRNNRLENLRAIPGIYLPGASADAVVVQARTEPDLDRLHVPGTFLVPHLRAVHDRPVVEIQRGCCRGCRFCQAGMIYRPVRQRAPHLVRSEVIRAVEESGQDEVGLLSLSAGDYGTIEHLLQDLGPELAHRRAALSIPSLRVATLSPQMVRELSRMRTSGFTLAPEAATERLRNVVGKPVSEKAMVETIAASLTAGATHIKLYFMIGLPTETDEDVLAIPRLASHLAGAARAINRRARATISISTFVPKPFTPFQWEAFLPPAEIRRRQRLIRAALDPRIGLKLHDPEMSLVEALYARGDRRLATVLLGAYRSGARLDAWSDHFDVHHHLDAAIAAAVNVESEIAARSINQRLPWAFIGGTVHDRFLRAERTAALYGATRSDCTIDVCHACGVCDFTRSNVVTYRQGPEGPVRVSKPLGHRDNRAIAETLAHQATMPGTKAPPPAEQPRDGRRPEPSRQADPRVARLRLTFTREEPATHLSHLETMAAIARALRRAGALVAYSGGFHAKPRISNPYALPTGLVSMDEKIDVDLRAELDPAHLTRRLASALPAGLRLRYLALLPPSAPGLGHCYQGARYQVHLHAPREMAERLALLDERDCWPVLSVRGERRREHNLKTLLVEHRLDGNRLSFVLLAPGEGSLRPQEALDAVFGSGDGAAWSRLVKTETILVSPAKTTVDRRSPKA